jgi:hypothetical protein
MFERLNALLEPWDYRYPWYPHFQFGWSLGQEDKTFSPYSVRGEPVPWDVAMAASQKSEAEQDHDKVFMMEAGIKDSQFSDATVEASVQVQTAAAVVASSALPIMRKLVSKGSVDEQFFSNPCRIAPRGPQKESIALGVALSGDIPRALVLLDECQAHDGSGRLAANYELLRCVIREVA